MYVYTKVPYLSPTRLGFSYTYIHTSKNPLHRRPTLNDDFNPLISYSSVSPPPPLYIYTLVYIHSAYPAAQYTSSHPLQPYTWVSLSSPLPCLIPSRPRLFRFNVSIMRDTPNRLHPNHRIPDDPQSPLIYIYNQSRASTLSTGIDIRVLFTLHIQHTPTPFAPTRGYRSAAGRGFYVWKFLICLFISQPSPRDIILL